MAIEWGEYMASAVISAAIIGGDERQLYMAEHLSQNGLAPVLYGFDCCRARAGEYFCDDLETAVCGADMVILPIPVSRDGVTLNAPYSGGEIALGGLLHMIRPAQTVFAGMMRAEHRSSLFQKGVRVYDYADRDEFTVRNAVPTAEGVVELAIRMRPATVNGSSAAVVGYGKTGKAVAKALGALGACVTVAARKCGSVYEAENDGHCGMYTKDLSRRAGDFDILVNTVPALVIDACVLRSLRPDCLILEIASAPYGIDMNAAKALGLDVVIAGSLPGKTAPKTAGIIISETILNITELLGDNGEQV